MRNYPILNSTLVILCPLVLSACIGSALVVDDADHSATFPDLHAVPERPLNLTRPKIEPLKQKTETSPEEILKENAQLRQAYGL